MQLLCFTSECNCVLHVQAAMHVYMYTYRYACADVCIPLELYAAHVNIASQYVVVTFLLQRVCGLCANT
jgi:hypothetical protein